MDHQVVGVSLCEWVGQHFPAFYRISEQLLE